MDRSVPHSRSNFPPFVSFGHRCTSFLGPASLGAGLPIRSERRQRRCGRTAADRVVYACMDERDPFTRRLRTWTRCFRALDVLEMSTLVGCSVDRRWRRNDSSYLRKAGAIGSHFEEQSLRLVFDTVRPGLRNFHPLRYHKLHKTPAKEHSLDLISRQFKRSAICFFCLFSTVETAKYIGARRVEEIIFIQFSG